MHKLFLLLLFLISGVCTSAQKKTKIVHINTSYGDIFVWLFDETPRHKESFMQLARKGYWDTLTINRVIPKFVIQGGCPDTPDGFNDPDYLLEPEFDSSLRHHYGSFAAGRDDNSAKLSARCQFYIVVNKAGLPRLDNKYTVYGKVVKGMEIADSISRVPRNKEDAPLNPVPLKITILSLSKKALKNKGIQLPVTK